MALTDGLDDLAQRRTLERWERLSEAASGLDAADLRALGAMATGMRARLDRVIARAMALPAAPARALPAPEDAAWSWRPEPFAAGMEPAGLAGVASGTALGPDLRVFHDCPLAQISVRWSREAGLGLDILDFEGSFVSLMFDLPAGSTCTSEDMVRVDLRLETESPTPVFARLNLRQGPSVHRLVRLLDMRHAVARAEFDLAATALGAAGADQVWLDLMPERPALNRLDLGDLIVSRRRRAAL